MNRGAWFADKVRWAIYLLLSLMIPAHAADRYRGFNLLQKFYFSGERHAYEEKDFALIAEWGFNFVRLPLDYRGYIREGNWELFDETSLAQIDQAVEWGKKYGLHVSINLHRAPGYTVAKPAEARVLWTDAEAQRVAAMHWEMFAKRYRDVPGDQLSFNLFNEPAEVTLEQYLPVLKKMVETIRAIDPDRMIFSDGLDWGKQPLPECIPLQVGMMTRGYTPFPLTHYKAPWAGGDRFPVPKWPALEGTSGQLYGPGRQGYPHELVIQGNVAAKSTMHLVVQEVCTKAVLELLADDQVIWKKELFTGAGEGPWKSTRLLPEWNVYVATYDQEFVVPIPQDASRLVLRMTEGDRAIFSSVSIRSSGKDARVALTPEWNVQPEILHYKDGTLGAMRDRAWLKKAQLDPWLDFRKQGGVMMVGEWGAHQHTPHDVLLRWAEDQLSIWKESDVGWALWNLHGSFGVLDSGRADVDYEEFRGAKLDRKLLELLQKY